MGFELRTQVVEPKRQTFDNLVRRFGDRPASRYEEGTFDVQATEHFHYRPLWDPTHEIYDPDYSVLKLADPYVYTDPRQLYYTPYVITRADLHEAFAQTLRYLEERALLDRLPAAWATILSDCVLPVRHYEAGAQLVAVTGARFAWGTSVEQAATFAAFDRIGNAQLLSLLGLALGGGAGDRLAEAKSVWLDAAALQPLREYTERLMAERDWGVGFVGLELVDAVLYPLLWRHLDEQALLDGAGAYSLVARHFSEWYTDQQKANRPLWRAWLSDPTYGESNTAALGDIVAAWLPRAVAAVGSVAEAIDATGATTGAAAACEDLVASLTADLTGLGVSVPTVAGGSR